MDRLLDHPVEGRRNSQQPFSPIALGNLYSQYCIGLVYPGFQCVLQSVPVILQKGFQVINPDAVNTS